MDETEFWQPPNESPAVPAPETVCSYCGSRLDPGYYFCTTCATPYQSEELVITPSRPMVLTEGELIARKAPSAWPMFWTYLSTLIGSAVLGHFLFDRNRPDLLMLMQVVALLIVTCFYAARHWRCLAMQFARLGLFQPSAILAVLILVPTLAINYGYHSLLFRLSDVQMRTDEMLTSLREAGLERNAIIFLFCLFPAITEEIAFRGLLQHWLQVAVRPWRAIVLASALFAAMHLSILSAPYLLALGMLLGWVKWKTNSLYPSMLIHFLHNFIVVMFFWGWH